MFCRELCYIEHRWCDCEGFGIGCRITLTYCNGPALDLNRFSCTRKMPPQFTATNTCCRVLFVLVGVGFIEERLVDVAIPHKTRIATSGDPSKIGSTLV